MTRILHGAQQIRTDSRQIRDRFAKVLHSIRADSQQIRESSRWMRDGFAQVRKGSHKIFADSRQIRGFSMDSRIRDGVRRFAQIRDRFAKVLDTIRADSRQIRDRFADSHSRFAQVRKDSRWILHGSPCKMCVKSPSRHPCRSLSSSSSTSLPAIRASQASTSSRGPASASFSERQLLRSHHGRRRPSTRARRRRCGRTARASRCAPRGSPCR